MTNSQKTFKNFEKRIEHDLLILYKNSSLVENRFKKLEHEINLLKEKI